MSHILPDFGVLRKILFMRFQRPEPTEWEINLFAGFRDIEERFFCVPTIKQMMLLVLD